MKIVHIITGLNDGGAEGTLYRLCKHDKQNHHVVISLMDLGKYGNLFSDENIPVHCLKLTKGFSSLSKFICLIKLIKIEKPDVVQTWMYHADLLGGVAAKLAGVKSVFWGIRHSNLTPGTVKKSTLMVVKVCGLLSKVIPIKIVCCAEDAIKSHTNVGYDSDKCITIPNGYCLDEYKPNLDISEIDKEFNFGDEILLGMVGRFDIQKDHANLLTALSIVKKTYPNFKCLLVGTNMVQHNLKLNFLIKNADCTNNILLLGKRADIPLIMNRIDLHILSSLGEAFPNVLAEAMACGTPCVTTDVGDASIIVGNSGWVVPPQNSDELAQAILLALAVKMNDSKNWNYRKKQSRIRIEENFAIEVMIKKYNQVWVDNK